MKSYLSASAVWDFVQKNKQRLEHEMAMIAENEDTGYSVCVTVESGICKVVAFRGELQVYSEGCVDAEDCRDVCVNAVFRYLIPYTESIDKLSFFDDDEPGKKPDDDGPPTLNDEDFVIVGDNEPDFEKLMDACHDEVEVTEKNRKDLEDVISLRDDDLVQATRDYLDVLLEEPAILETEEGEKLMQDFLDAVQLYLADLGHYVWAPAIFRGDNGDILIPYPAELSVSIM